MDYQLLIKLLDYNGDVKYVKNFTQNQNSAQKSRGPNHRDKIVSRKQFCQILQKYNNLKNIKETSFSQVTLLLITM